MSASTAPEWGDDVMTERQLAPRLGVSVSALQNWRLQGTGPPYYRIGTRAIRYRWDEVLAWMEEGRVPA